MNIVVSCRIVCVKDVCDVVSALLYTTDDGDNVVFCMYYFTRERRRWKRTNEQTNKQTNTQTNKEANKQTNKPTNIQPNIFTIKS